MNKLRKYGILIENFDYSQVESYIFWFL
jgi:hypothetical protein